LCQFEPRLVLKFLESYENYRLEHCLKLCQEYGITDAAIFLLERVGDVASALGLVLVEVDACMLDFKSAIMASSSLAAQVSNNNDKWLDIPQVHCFSTHCCMFCDEVSRVHPMGFKPTRLQEPSTF